MKSKRKIGHLFDEKEFLIDRYQDKHGTRIEIWQESIDNPIIIDVTIMNNGKYRKRPSYSYFYYYPAKLSLDVSICYPVMDYEETLKLLENRKTAKRWFLRKIRQFPLFNKTLGQFMIGDIIDCKSIDEYKGYLERKELDVEAETSKRLLDLCEKFLDTRPKDSDLLKFLRDYIDFANYCCPKVKEIKIDSIKQTLPIYSDPIRYILDYYINYSGIINDLERYEDTLILIKRSLKQDWNQPVNFKRNGKVVYEMIPYKDLGWICISLMKRDKLNERILRLKENLSNDDLGAMDNLKRSYQESLNLLENSELRDLFYKIID